MKRDKKVLLQILERIEKISDFEQIFQKHSVSMDFEAIDQSIINYHLLLLEDANLIQLASRNEKPKPIRLTWEGHNYLDELREKINKKTTEIHAEVSSESYIK